MWQSKSSRFVLFETWLRKQEDPELSETLTLGETLVEQESS